MPVQGIYVRVRCDVIHIEAAQSPEIEFTPTGLETECLLSVFSVQGSRHLTRKMMPSISSSLLKPVERLEQGGNCMITRH